MLLNAMIKNVAVPLTSLWVYARVLNKICAAAGKCACPWGVIIPLTSTTEVYRGSCTQSFIGSMCRKEFSTNSASLCTVVYTAKHRCTSQISVCQCPTSQHGSIFDPLLGVSWWFRDAVSAHSVHGPSLWPAHRFGTLYETA